ncbi:MAG: acyl-CoA dehydrogenase family protein, partial [Betaproteobacteria bacterium]|nr:acyl-CoA dehydrogenase family protein [Betaproteobacteria bacterium]
MILSDEQLQVRDAIADFCRHEIVPKAAQWDREHHFPREVHQALAALGCYGVMVPQEHGGAGLDTVCLALILEEIGAADGGTSTAISV